MQDQTGFAVELNCPGHDFGRIKVHAEPRHDGGAIQEKEVLPRGHDWGPGLPDPLKSSLEALSGFDLSDIRVERDSTKPAALNALAYAQGRDIHLGPGQEEHLAHEAWHVVQQKQGRVRPPAGLSGESAVNFDPQLESEADRVGKDVNPAFSPQPGFLRRDVSPNGTGRPIQLMVRVGGGATHVDETYYQTGGGKAIGSKHSVAGMIGDPIKRVLNDKAELEAYANGKTDYIGDVTTGSGKTYWYRLPKNKLTVLGEYHENPEGYTEDIVLGLQTSRFMYEPFNEVTGVAGIKSFPETQSQVSKVSAGRKAGKMVDPKFDPSLENIVIKALTGALITRNEFIAGNPSGMKAGDQKKWGKRASTSEWSYGERAALYLSMAIHIARDIAKQSFGPPTFVELPYISNARDLQKFYLANQAVLDAFVAAKDADDLIGIYELTSPGGFKNLGVIKDFTLVFHQYGASYVAQLGAERGNKTLEAEGNKLAASTGGDINVLSPAREEIMWQKIEEAVKKNYLLVGMGDDHHKHLTPRLDKAKIPHDEVVHSLKAQKTAVEASWKP